MCLFKDINLIFKNEVVIEILGSLNLIINLPLLKSTQPALPKDQPPQAAGEGPPCGWVHI